VGEMRTTQNTMRLFGAYSLCASITLVTSGAQAGIIFSGLTGYWEGNGNAHDSSPTGNNGTFAGSYAPGIDRRKAFDLATPPGPKPSAPLGDVVIPDNAAYDFGTSLSVGFWFNRNGVPFPDRTSWIMIGQDVGGGDLPKWFIGDVAPYLGLPSGFELVLGGPDLGQPGAGIFANDVPVPAGWNQLTLVVTDTASLSGYTFYLDGVSLGSVSLGLGSGPYQGTFPNPSAPLAFGFQDGGDAFPGLMQDVVLYNRALTPIEVQTLAARATTIPEPASLALYGTGLLAAFAVSRRRRKAKA